MASAHPHRVRRAAVITIPLFTPEEVAEFKDRYVTHPVPIEDGSHLLWYWSWWRDGGFDGSAPRSITYPPERSQEWVLEHLRALPHFWWAYHAVIEYPTADRLPMIARPFLLLRSPDDMAEQTEAAVPLLPAQAQVVDLPRFAEVLRYYDWSPEDVGEVAGHLRDFLS